MIGRVVKNYGINSMAETLSFQERSLTQQGYKYTKAELRKLEGGLRFTPLVCMTGAAYGRCA